MKQQPVARRHHYIPQGYLAAFTSNGVKGGQFNVLEVHTGHVFRTSPLNVASQRDFNLVDTEGYPPDAIESALAPVEGEMFKAIREVIETQCFPNDSDQNLILNFLGLIAVRNPKLRSSFNDWRERVLRHTADFLVSDEKIWNHYKKSAREGGEIINESTSFDDFKRFVEEGDYNIEFHPQGNLRVEFEAFDKLLPILGERTWSLLLAPPDGPEFISSDHPVTLVWKGGRSGPIGFGLKETEVFLPLGRRVGFYGVYETPLNPVVTCKPSNVAEMNRRVAWNAERHVYSTQESFCVWYEGRIREVGCV